ncbi:hypothetical protein GYMLUDRAFT_37878 [Collybiopsis luxurians FD-317 M1]|nr:hypothetical protein GYMLUDRAFT_37878 [Collybiopsis luxurians FD-317 M1]
MVEARANCPRAIEAQTQHKNHLSEQRLSSSKNLLEQEPQRLRSFKPIPTHSSISNACSATMVEGAGNEQYSLSLKKLERLEAKIRDIETRASPPSFWPRGNGILNRIP